MVRLVRAAAGRAADHLAAGPSPGARHDRCGERRRRATVSDDQFAARVLCRRLRARHQHVPCTDQQTHPNIHRRALLQLPNARINTSGVICFTVCIHSVVGTTSLLPIAFTYFNSRSDNNQTIAIN